MHKKLNAKFVRIFSIILFVFFAFYLLYQAISFNNSAYKTQTAILQSVEAGIDTDVFIVRDEKCLNKINSDKVTVSMVDDGERVAENEIIAACFDSQQEADDFKKLDLYKKELSRYLTLSSQEKINISDIATFDNDTNTLFEKYIKGVNSDDFSLATECVNEFCEKLTSRQAGMGQEVNLKKTIDQINAKIYKLGKVNPKYIYSDSTGYYVNGVDGFENQIKYQDVLNITPKQIKDAMKNNNKSSNSYAGKIINNFNWYMVCVVTAKDVQDLEVGDGVTVQFKNSASLEERVEIAAINMQDNDNVALVLRCNNVTTSLFSFRCEKVKIVTEKLEGYKINKDAVRTVNGQNGVYVLRGKIINFRNIDIIYTASDYVLVMTYDDKNQQIIDNKEKLKEEKLKSNSKKSQRYTEESGNIISSESIHSPSMSIDNYVRLYDEVIIKGSDLQDGKLI